jgi:hypothetical protein
MKSLIWLREQGRDSLRALSPAAVLATAWALSLVYAYPGQLTGDTLTLLEQVRVGVYSEAYSPAMGVLWHVAEWVIGGQIGMLLLQSLTLLVGLFWIARHGLAPRPAAWVTAAVYLFPPVMLPMAVVAKSSLLAGLTVLGIGALLSPQRRRQVLGLAALAVACAVSSDAAIAAFPPVVLLFRWRATASSPVRYGVALALWLALSSAGLAASAGLTTEHDNRGSSYAAQSLPSQSAAFATPDESVAPGRLALVRQLLFDPNNAVTPRHKYDRRIFDLNIRNRWSGLQRHLSSVAREVAAYSPLFSPWFYLVVLALVAWRGRRNPLLVVLLTSAATHLGAMLVLASAPDFAHAQWMVLAVVMASAMWLAAAWARRASASQDTTESNDPEGSAQPGPDGSSLGPAFRANLSSSWRDAAHRWFTPTKILVGGWIGLLLYAYPGYMSYDSIYQLREARSGVFSDWHPPMMAAIWRVVDYVLAGPFGMLTIQSWTFLLGAYLLARRAMPARLAAIAASFVLLFPTVSAVMAVIWKDSQMCGFLLLGAGLLLSPKRKLRMLGLISLCLATAMRHNALTMTLPIVVLLFVWHPRSHGWRRYAISIAAWLAVTLFARFASQSLTSDHRDLWHDGLARYDITGTINYIPDLDDDKLRVLLDGAPIAAQRDLVRGAKLDHQNFFISLWAATGYLLKVPSSAEERAAISRVWRDVVVGHPFAFLQYRWGASREILQLSGVAGFPIYIWFTDIGDPIGSSKLVQHQSTAAYLQIKLQLLMLHTFGTPLVYVYVYMILALAILPLCRRHRVIGVLVLSGLSSEAALLLLSPAPDTRYSMWLSLSVVLAIGMLIAHRIGMRAAEPPLSVAL